MADFGRALLQSGALDEIGNLQRRAFDVRKSALEGTGDLLKTGMAVSEFQQESEIRTQEIAAGKVEAAAVAKEEARRTRPVPFSIVSDQIERKFPGTGAFVTEQAIAFGAVDENGVSSPEKLERFQEFMLNNDEMGAKFIGMADAQINANAENIRRQIAELRAEKDPSGTSPQMAKLIEQQDAIAAQSMEMSELKAQTQIATDAAIQKGAEKAGTDKRSTIQADTIAFENAAIASIDENFGTLTAFGQTLDEDQTEAFNNAKKIVPTLFGRVASPALAAQTALDITSKRIGPEGSDVSVGEAIAAGLAEDMTMDEITTKLSPLFVRAFNMDPNLPYKQIFTNLVSGVQ